MTGAVNVCGVYSRSDRARGPRFGRRAAPDGKPRERSPCRRAVAHDDRRQAGDLRRKRHREAIGLARVGLGRAAPRARRRGRRRPESLRRCARGIANCISAAPPVAAAGNRLLDLEAVVGKNDFAARAVEVVAGEIDRLAEPGDRLLRRRNDRVEHRHRRHQARLDHDPAVASGRDVERAPREHRQAASVPAAWLWISTTLAMYAAVGRKWLWVAVQSLEISSVLRYSGVILICSTWCSSPESASARSAGGNVVPTSGDGFSAVWIASRVSTGIFVQQLHRVAEQDLRVQVAAAVGAEQVMQVERERRVAQAAAAGRVARRQAFVAPARGSA